MNVPQTSTQPFTRPVPQPGILKCLLRNRNPKIQNPNICTLATRERKNKLHIRKAQNNQVEYRMMRTQKPKPPLPGASFPFAIRKKTNKTKKTASAAFAGRRNKARLETEQKPNPSFDPGKKKKTNGSHSFSSRKNPRASMPGTTAPWRWIPSCQLSTLKKTTNKVQTLCWRQFHIKHVSFLLWTLWDVCAF